MSSIPPFNPNAKFSVVAPPNPAWRPGQGLGDSPLQKEWAAGDGQGWREFTPANTEGRELYRLLISGIVPRPIALVSSLSAEGVANLAPFSYFSLLRFKDTAANILATKQFTVQIISEPFVEAANFSCVNAPQNVSEWPGTGLTQLPSTLVKPPRVKESAFSMECELLQAHELHSLGTSRVGTVLIVGLIKLIHVRNDVLTEHNVVDATKLRAVSRLGDIKYGRTLEGFSILRPTWDEVAEEVGLL